jgi:hypothetical protein
MRKTHFHSSDPADVRSSLRSRACEDVKGVSVQRSASARTSRVNRCGSYASGANARTTAGGYNRSLPLPPSALPHARTHARTQATYLFAPRLAHGALDRLRELFNRLRHNYARRCVLSKTSTALRKSCASTRSRGYPSCVAATHTYSVVIWARRGAAWRLKEPVGESGVCVPGNPRTSAGRPSNATPVGLCA